MIPTASGQADPEARPLFIVGYPRSGTTLLRALLTAHPSIELVHEPELLTTMRQSGVLPGDTVAKAARPALLAQLRRDRPCGRHLASLPPHLLDQFLAVDEDLGFRQIYEALLPRPAQASSGKTWGEKSLGNLFLLRELHAMYPKSVAVHIVRNPYSTLLSYHTKRRKELGRPPLQFSRRDLGFFTTQAIQWSCWMREAASAFAQLPTAFGMVIKYEDLVADPRKELGRIVERLGVPFDEGMLDPTRRASDGALRPDTADAHHALLAKEIDRDRARSAAALPPWARLIVTRHAREAIAELGYAPEQAPVPPGERLLVEISQLLATGRARARVARSLATRRGSLHPR